MRKGKKKLIKLINEIINYSSDIKELISYSFKENFKDKEIPNEYIEDKTKELEQYLKEGKALLFCCFDNEILCGMAWCHDIDRFEKRIHIANIAVKPEYRNKGYGSLLIKEIEKYAYENNYSGIDLMVTVSNENSVNFYKKNGFIEERFLMKK